MTPEQISFFLQFIHLEKLFGNFPGASDQNIAPIFGLDAVRYQQIRDGFKENARVAAEAMLAEPDFAELVDRLPFASDSTILAVGDSVTDDDQSWLEILRHLLNIRRPGNQMQIINAGVSGDSTTHVISRFSELTSSEPDWILFMIGLNDARRHGSAPEKTLVSLDETGKNLDELRRFAIAQTKAELVWMTPPTLIEQKVSEFWLFNAMQTCWTNTDVDAVAQLIKQLPDQVVDVNSTFGLPPSPELLLEDGLHPSLEGQKVIAGALVETLAGRAS
ncbi:MAG: GDSL-type esterase/lipase family protein [Gammaproteobacteria bacterium]|nr:GDSL-type esterase/lipase family protein [Gammaproteobacteria bacterium]MDE0513111.1 GDSL-type esterase/lipase family protein [Gammaproteobacteria bacterium]